MDDTIVRLLKQANTQLENQGNEPGGGQSPTPGPSSLSALEKPLKGLGGVLGGIMNIPKDLIEASARDVYNLGDHTQPKESVGPAFEAASLLAGGGMPMAERGAAGIFGGRLAKTADLRALNEAEQMLAGGKMPDEIIRDTGWFRGPADHKWRFEIPDNKSVMNFMPDREGDKAMSSALSLFRHPDLYKAYPQLGTAPMSVTKDSSRPKGTGSFWSTNNAIDVNAPDWSTGRGVALHEMQHGVQGIEGFSPGANPNFYAMKMEENLRKDPNWAGAYDYDDLRNRANALYHLTAGEVEARNVANRMNMSPADRRKQLPWYTQDVPYSNQVAFDPVAETIRALRTGETIK